jgi:hypothetical protein
MEWVSETGVPFRERLVMNLWGSVRPKVSGYIAKVKSRGLKAKSWKKASRAQTPDVGVNIAFSSASGGWGQWLAIDRRMGRHSRRLRRRRLANFSF